MKTTEELKLIGIDELIPYANNARIHSKDQINRDEKLGTEEKYSRGRMFALVRLL